MTAIPVRLAWLPVWRRNFLVWRKLALPSVLGNLADPLIYMLGLGYGLGAMLPEIAGQSYVAFLAAGTVCASTMNAATRDMFCRRRCAARSCNSATLARPGRSIA